MNDFARLEAIAADAEATGPAAEAIAAWRKAIAAAPERAEPRRALARLLRREQRWDDLIAALRAELERACTSPEARYAVLMETVDLFLHQLDRRFLALGAAKQALEANPDGVEALDVLIAIYEAKRSWGEVVPLLERRLQLSTDPDVRIAILERIAAASLERPQGGQNAMDAFERLLEEQPGCRKAEEALVALYTKLGAWEKLVLFQKGRLLSAHGGADLLEMAVELAELAQQKVKRIEVQRDLWLTVRELDPLHDGALKALDPIYQRQHAWKELAEVLTSQLEASIDPEHRTGLLQRLALLYEGHLADEPGADERAVQAWREVLLHSPSHPRARNALRDLYARRGEIGALDELYADHEARAYAIVLEQLLRREQLPTRAALLRRLGRLQLDDLGNAKKATATYEALAHLVPQDSEAVQTLVKLYEDAHDHHKLVDALGRLLELTDDTEGKVVLLQQLAALREERFASHAEALSCWLTALSLQPDDTHLRREAERLAQLSGHWQRLVDVYGQLVTGLPPESRVAFLATMAEAQEQHLQQLSGAGVSYQAVLAIDPGHTQAQEGLVRVLLAEGRYEALFEHYARKLALGSAAEASEEQTTQKRLSIYRELAELLEMQMHRPAEAMEMLGRALRESPGETQTLDQLEAVAARHALWERLLQLYREITSRPLPLAPQVELRSRVGRLYEERFSNPTRALSAYRRVLDLDPKNAPARRAVARISHHVAR